MPTVSVVMGVHNAGDSLDETLDSILLQEACDLEFIVVDDGSTDGTGERLDWRSESDNRLRVVHQQNQGLTKALRRGCEMASSEFIARQDAGDVSAQGRLAAQVEFLQRHPSAVMTACAVQFLGPCDEPLYEIRKPDESLDAGLRRNSVADVAGPPHHGSVMFRRDAYLRSGGYRAAFVVAQDLDLWLRLAEQGQCLGTDLLHYRARLHASGISSRLRDEQMRMTQVALDCRIARAAGADEEPLLEAAAMKRKPKRGSSRLQRARFHYFVASCLRRRDPEKARKYYGQALRDNPFHLKAIVRLGIG